MRQFWLLFIMLTQVCDHHEISVCSHKVADAWNTKIDNVWRTRSRVPRCILAATPFFFSFYTTNRRKNDWKIFWMRQKGKVWYVTLENENIMHWETHESSMRQAKISAGKLIAFKDTNTIFFTCNMNFYLKSKNHHIKEEEEGRLLKISGRGTRLFKRYVMVVANWRCCKDDSEGRRRESLRIPSNVSWCLRAQPSTFSAMAWFARPRV